MDFFLSRITQQAMNYAIRSGITITSGYALSQCSRLLKTKSGQERENLENLKNRLENKIRIISPAIDMIELIAARGNTSLESAVSLTKSLRWDIQSLGERLAKAAAEGEMSTKRSARAKSAADNELELKRIISDMKNLLDRIEDAVPLINLAITTSGASLSTSLPLSISPSRLLQASTFLTAGDTQYGLSNARAQIGPAFTLSVYMLFAGHAHRPKDDEGFRTTTWKEVIHKARVKLMRAPLDSIYDLPVSPDTSSDKKSTDQANPSRKEDTSRSIPADVRANEFAYHMLIIEDLEDDRVHTFEEGDIQPSNFDDVNLAGIRELVPVHEISKVFYADTGKILNIGADGGPNNPVLLLKRDVNAVPPRRMMDREQTTETSWLEDDDVLASVEPETGSDFATSLPRAATQTESTANLLDASKKRSHPWRIPPDLDPEWMAFEVYTEEEDSEEETEIQASDSGKPVSRSTRSQSSRQSSLEPSFTTGLSQLNLSPSPSSSLSGSDLKNVIIQNPLDVPNSPHSPGGLYSGTIPAIQTSLSLLDMLLRLTSLQQFEQTSHLAIPDELINFFLQESATTGVNQGDSPERRRIRREARERVGFDPYMESPLKREGQNYRHQTNGQSYASQWHGGDGDSELFDRSTETSPSARSDVADSRGSGSRKPTSHRSTSARESPTIPVPLNRNSPATPPSTTKSRQRYFRDQVTKGLMHRPSPLAKGAWEDDTNDKESAAS